MMNERSTLDVGGFSSKKGREEIKIEGEKEKVDVHLPGVVEINIY